MPSLMDLLGETWPARMAKSAWSAAKLPGDVYAGRTDPLSEEGIGRAADLGGMVMGGTFAGAPAGAMGAGPVASDLWHGISKVKLPRPVSEMSATHVPTAPLNEKIITPEALQGGWLLPAWGDRSATNSLLSMVGDKPLANPVAMQGGHGFMPANVESGAAWASGKPVIGRLAKQARELGASGDPVYFPYTAMGERSIDFAHHVSDALSEMVKGKSIPAKTVSEFNSAMKKADANFPAIEDWPGLRSPKLREWLAESGGDARNKFAKIMDTRGMQAGGMPSVAEARFATTDRRLLDVPTGSAGQSIARLDPEGRVITAPSTPHRTYDTQLGGKYVGGLAEMVPKEVMYPQMLDAYRKMGYDPFRFDYLMQRGVRGAPIAQRADQQWVDSISRYLEQANRQGQ